MSIEDTLSLVKRALAKANTGGELAKANTFVTPGTPTTGLQSYDLEAPAKNLYPVFSPLRNRIPRVGGKGGSQSNWKAVTGLNVNKVYSGVMEGRRGQMINHSVADYSAVYRTIGQESAVTFEAELAAEGFDDLRARSATMMLQSMMVEEERIILGSNTSLQLGVTNTPTLVAATTGGAIAASTVVSVICVALSYDAYRRLNGSTVNSSLVIAPVLTVTPTDGMGTYTTGGGFATKSSGANLTVNSSSSANMVTATVAPTRGAYGYAWFWGPIGSEVLGAITTVTQCVITATAAGTTAASLFSSDNSTNSLVFDGLLTIVSNPNFNGYWFAQKPGLGLTGDGASGIVEFDTLLQYMWDTWRLQPNRMIVASQEMLAMRKKIAGVGGAASAVRFVFNVGPGQTLTGGGKPVGYLSPFTMTGGPSEITIELHPDMPPGTVLFTTDVLPYPVNGVSNIIQVKTRRDYYQLEWPLRTRSYEYGVYSDEVLQHYAPFSMGVITNLSNA